MKFTSLRKLLAHLGANPTELAKHLPWAVRSAGGTVPASVLYAGKPITDSVRNELLAKLKAGEHVEIDVQLHSFEQTAGEQNRNFVRFRDGAMLNIGRSGKSTPFLRDHLQRDSSAKGGTIHTSATTKVDEGKYSIDQVATLKAPWAVEAALHGLIEYLSIGWNPTGPVICSVHNTPVWTRCDCWPGDRLAEVEDEAGGKRKVYKADGPIVAEWVYTAAELVETSMVNVPAVPQARAQEVRASLFATLSASHPGLVDDIDTDNGENEMNRAALIALLGLAETATDEEILAAAEKLKKEGTTDKVTLEILKKDLDGFKDQITALTADRNRRDEETFITDALASGRITKGDEKPWRSLFGLDAKKAREQMGERAEGSATPVGLAPQRSNDPDKPMVITLGSRVPMSLATRRDNAIVLLKSNPQAAAWAAVLGLDPKGRFAVPATLAATTITNDAELEPARIGFQAAFLEAIAGEPDPSMMLATETNTNKKEENYSWVGDLPGMQEWKTDRMLKVLEAYGLAIRNKKWEASLRLKNDDIADDNLGLLPPLINDMAANARRHPSILVARLLLNGFAGTAFPDLGDGLAWDGEFFFSTTHDTGSNKLTVVFSADNLEAAALLLRKQKRLDPTEKEGSLYAQGTHLFVGVSNERLAEKVMTQEYLAGGESNTQRNKYKLVVTPEFADGEWMLADLRGAVRPVIFQSREPITTSTVGGKSNADTVGFMYDELWMGAKARYNAGYFDFRRIVGSKP